MSVELHKTIGTAVTVSCPASIANLVCGFDVLGMALNSPQDLMRVQLSEMPGIPFPIDPSFVPSISGGKYESRAVASV